MAVAFIDGCVGERQFSDERVLDPEVVALREKVTATVDSGIAPDEVNIEVALKDGRKLSKHIAHALGSLKRPLTDRDLENKFRDLTEEILSTEQSRKLIELCWALPGVADPSEIARAAAVS